MILLDTDHVTVLKYRDSARYARLSRRLAEAVEPFGTTIITVEEQMRGWLATVAKERTAIRQVNPYRELGRLFDFFAELNIEYFNEAAAAKFDEFNRLKISTMDRKIAAIAVTQNALLLTANHRDFSRVPGLRIENWMDDPMPPTG